MATRKRKRRRVEDDGVANDEDGIPVLRVFEAMENGRSQIIVHIAGSPGSGKTTLGNWISNNLKVPVIDTDDFINHGSKEGKELLQMSDKSAAYKRRWAEILDVKFEEAIAQHALAPLLVFVGLLDHFGPPDNSYHFFRQATARYFLDVPLPQLLKQFYVRIGQDEKRRADASEKSSDEYWEGVAEGKYTIPGAKDIVKNNAADVKWHKAHKYEMLPEDTIRKRLLAIVQQRSHHDHEKEQQQGGPLIMRLSGVPGSGKTFVCTQLSKLPGGHCVDMDVLSTQAYRIVRQQHPQLAVESEVFERLWGDEEEVQVKEVVAANGNRVLVFAGVVFVGMDRTLNTKHKFFIKLEPGDMDAVYRRFLLREQAKFVDKDAQVKQQLIQESKSVETLEQDLHWLTGALGPRSYVEFVDDYKTKVEEFSGLGYVVASQEDIMKHIQQLALPYQALDVASMEDCQSCSF